VQAFVDLADMASFNRNAGLLIESGVDVPDAIVCADFDNIPKARGYEQSGGGASLCQQRVGSHGRTVYEGVDLREIDAGLLEGIEHCLVYLLWLGGNLSGADTAIRLS